MKENWLYTSRHMIARGGPHREPDLTYIRSGEVWRDYPKAVCATWSSEFDLLTEGNYWYVIKDTPFEVTQLKAKRRYEITKGLRNFSVSVVGDVEAVRDELYEVYLGSLKGYSGEGVKTMSKESFCSFCKVLNNRQLNNGGMNLVFAVRSKLSGKMCGFAHVPLYHDWAAFSTMKTIPEYERLGVNAALVAGILEHLAPRLANKGFFFSDGARTLYHKTAFQDYLEKYFQFRKAYCRLNVAYNPRYKYMVKILYPFKGILSRLSFLQPVRGLMAVLTIENIVRNY